MNNQGRRSARKKGGGIESIKRKYGYLFVAPWLFGVLIFVLAPMITCFFYSFSEVTLLPEGLESTFVGLRHYKKLFLDDPYYLNDIFTSFSSLFTSMPIVVALSMILAIVLNQKFRGRLLARTVFFLPVIIASGAVMSVVAGSFGMTNEITAATGGGKQTADFVQVIDFSALLHSLNLPENISSLIEGYLQNTFNLIWSCGVQILLFVAGLQTIPVQLYEAGRVEGITTWEEFWYITVPMMGRVILLVVFYTMVELFITKGVLVNKAITKIQSSEYSASSAMLWPYFALVGIVIGAVIFIYNRACLRRWE